ncbi:MAG: HAMP domain-containing protein [Nitrospirae bacterium]|nr:HAMP domain-containing protein [Nitrospirota bacterium]
MKIFGKSLHSLTGKLLVLIGSLFIISGSIAWYVFTFYTKEKLMDEAIKYAGSFVELTKKSTHYGMQNNQRETIQETIKAIGIAEGIRKVRIFNPEGKIAYSSKVDDIGSFVDKSDPTCQSCHVSPIRHPLGIEPQRLTVFKKAPWIITEGQGERLLKFVTPIYNEPSCYTAKCHVHSKNVKVLGLMEMDFSLSLIDKAIWKQTTFITVFGAIFAFVLSLSLCLILYKLVSKPVTLLADGMKEVASGELDYRVEINTKDEMGMLAQTYTRMTKELKAAREKLEGWTRALEEEVAKKTEEIRKSHEQMIHTEKLASLGRMAAGVAHEINSPLTGIVTFAHLMLKRIPPENKLDREDLEVIIEQAERCSKIIKGLLGFSRATPSEKRLLNINEVINRSIRMVSSKADFHNIKFEINMDDTLPPVAGDLSQLQQVFLNILINASDAMNNRGAIHVATRRVFENETAFVEVEFTDTGPGIPEEHLEKLFEPFFTTKPVGKGTGLGLAVSHGIIQEHGGTITAKSERGKGASFFIRLPIAEVN